MTRFEEKLYLQSVFDAIDQVYKMKKPSQISTYEERLRASFNKLLIPDWYNHEYTSINGLRKTKSHGHVPRVKKNNNHNDDTPDTSVSSSVNSPHLSNGTHRQSYRHRSPSRSWSERPPLRRDSTASSYDTNGSIIQGRRSITSNGSSTYAPGVQRVAQSSTWYKPRTFAPKITNGNTNGHSIEPPKPLPRYSKIDQQRIHSLDSAALPSKIENIRCPIKPRTMAQAQIPPEESLLDVSSDGDVTLVQISPIPQTNEILLPSQVITNIPRTNSLRSISSEADSYRSANLPPTDKDLLATDSSSYASVNDRCLSPSTASYHTAVAGDTSSSSSMTGYETPTPQLDDDNATLSSHSSLSDLSHAETLEPNAEDLDIVAVSTAEQKSVINPPVNNNMENSLLSSTNTDSRSTENSNWYEGSLETSVHPIQTDSSEIREISNDENLHEVDINAVGDEFFLCSPRTTNDDEPSNLINNDQPIESPTQTSKRIFTMDDKNSNHFTDFHFSSSNDPFGFDHNTNSSLMITNLDDLLINEDDENNRYQRRPIQEDILYEVEHENSFSDHSQNASSIIAADDKTSPSIRMDANIDYLTSTDSPNISPILENEKQTSSSSTTTTTKITDNNILPIYILPPLFTTSKTEEPSTSLHIDTDDNFQKWDSYVHRFSDLTSPSAYTSKIRHRHYSVGSYYDHKTTTVTLHPNYTHYILGSAPVSPLSRASTTSSESHYHLHHQNHSPVTYDNVSFNALRRVNPFLESNNQDYRQTTNYRSSSLNREEKTRVITYTSPKIISKSVERTIPITPIVPQSITSPSSIRTSFVAFPQYEIPNTRPKQTNEMPISPPPLPPPRPIYFEQESTVIRPRTSRGRAHTPPPLIQIKSQNIYQEIDSTSTDDDQIQTPNSDLQFIRGAIDRVFHFNGESTTDTTSESSINYEEVSEDKFKKLSNQYPAVQAVQRFYNTEKKLPSEQITNLDDNLLSTSSTSKKSVITARKKNPSSSEEIDDTLNDIEDVDYHDEKSKRQLTSNENSPNQSKKNKTSQETQTIGRQKPLILQTRSTVPPIDIVTEMIIEQDDVDDDGNNNNGEIHEADGDMVIFYDDIEIVEHSTSSCSSESESSSSESDHYSRPQPPPPPPIPARTLKPNHLVHNSQHQSPSITNQTYDLEKSLTRKKFDVNSVNDMLNRTDYNIGPATSHRHPSARHFVGKLNTEDSPSSQPITTNGHKHSSTKTPFSTLPTTNSSNGKHRSVIADTNALVKQIQNSLSRNSLHDKQVNTKNLSTSSKNLREFVSSTYSPSDENIIDDNGIVHIRQKETNHDEQIFKKQARLSKSFHNVSEYNSTDQYPKTENNLTSIPQPAKSVENNLNHVKSLDITSVVTSTSFSALPNSDDNARMLSMKWYTGHVSENSEICYDTHHTDGDDLLHGYITTHSNREIQALFARLHASNDPRIHAALDDIRSRVVIFDASKTQEDLPVFMRYLESRLRAINNKNSNGHQQVDSTSTNSKETIPSRQLGRQNHRSGETNGGPQPRRTSQSSANQENPAIFDDMLNTVLGLPKKGASALPAKRERPTPLVQSQLTTNTTANNKPGRDIGKRLFESGTYKDPRLIYDGPKRKEKEEHPLETSV